MSEDNNDDIDSSLTRFERVLFALPRFVVVIVGIFLLCFNDNWKAIAYPKIHPTDFGGLLTFLFTPLNIVLTGIGVTFALLIILFLLIRLLFTPLDEINIMGVGYKAKAKKQQKVAVKEVNLYRKIDVMRMSLLNTLGSHDFRERIWANYDRTNNVFEIYGMLIELCSVLESTYSRHLEEIDLSAGVVAVDNGALDNLQMSYLAQDIRDVVEKCFRRNMSINEKGQILSVPLKMEEEDSTYCIFYLKNTKKMFNNADQLLIQNAWRMIKNEVRLIELGVDSLEEVSS